MGRSLQSSQTPIVSCETAGRLEIYRKLLRDWQGVKNLVGKSTLEDSFQRHFQDSLQLLPIKSDARRWVDLGSGSGFPGLVVAIALREKHGAEIHLIESDHRKCAFLRTVARETSAPAVVHRGRIEDVLPSLPTPDAITARALAPMSQLMFWCSEKIAKGATGLYLKGRDVGSELTELTKYSNFKYELVPSITAPDASVVVVTAGHTPLPEREKV